MYEIKLRYEDLRKLITCVDAYKWRIKATIADTPGLAELFEEEFKQLGRIIRKANESMEARHVD